MLLITCELYLITYVSTDNFFERKSIIINSGESEGYKPFTLIILFTAL